MDDLDEALAAGARLRNDPRGASGLRPTDPYPTEHAIRMFRQQVCAMLDELDGSMTLSELREGLE